MRLPTFEEGQNNPKQLNERVSKRANKLVASCQRTNEHAGSTQSWPRSDKTHSYVALRRNKLNERLSASTRSARIYDAASNITSKHARAQRISALAQHLRQH